VTLGGLVQFRQAAFSCLHLLGPFCARIFRLRIFAPFAPLFSVHVAMFTVLSDKLGDVVAPLALTSRALNSQDVQLASESPKVRYVRGSAVTLT
jgi:hypothetical protein